MSILEILSMRRQLKVYEKSQVPIEINFGDCIFLYRVQKVNWFTVTLEELDPEDEETWLQTVTLHISSIAAIHISEMERARSYLAKQLGEEVPPMPAYNHFHDDDA